MYEKEINLIDMSFIFLKKLASMECVLWGRKMLKINFGGGVASSLMSLAIWPRIFRLSRGKKFVDQYQRIESHCSVQVCINEIL